MFRLFEVHDLVCNVILFSFVLTMDVQSLWGVIDHDAYRCWGLVFGVVVLIVLSLVVLA